MASLNSPGLRLRLPATSANLGPGFDALGLAMALYLTIDATSSAAFSIAATGRDAHLCGDADTSLILITYRDLAPSGPPLALSLHNEIPLGMGCGSSAAALLAGVLLANHFGRLGWSGQRILEEACRREGHPDNVAACWHGGMTASSMPASFVVAATCGRELKWNLILALPASATASGKTKQARALLPATYTRADAVANVQNTALLVAAFALDRPDLLRHAMRDRLHQPFRMEACPLLPLLLPMMEEPDDLGILGVSLSGAGPAVLLLATPDAPLERIAATIRQRAAGHGVEVLCASIAAGCADVP